MANGINKAQKDKWKLHGLWSFAIDENIDMTEDDNEIKGKRLGRVKTRKDMEMLDSKY